MSKLDFTISQVDRTVLNSGRLVSHPTDFGELLDRLPEDTSDAFVKGAYAIDKADPRGKASCAFCHQPTNHWGGIVIAYPGGAHAAIGNECCKKLGHDYKMLFDTFNQETSRTRQLTRLQIAIDLFPGAIAHMEALQAMPQIQQGRELHRKWFFHFGKLGGFLGASKGLLNGPVQVRDPDALAFRKAKRDEKVERLRKDMEARGERFDPAANFAAMFPNDPDFRTNELKKTVMQLHTTFRGSYFFSSFDHVLDDLKAATEAIFRTLWVYNHQASADCTTQQIRKSVIAFEAAITRAIAMIERINEGLAVFDQQGPIKDIMAWAQHHADDSIRIGGTYGWKPGAVICTFQDGRDRSVEYTSMPPLAAAPLRKALAQLRQVAAPDALAA